MRGTLMLAAVILAGGGVGLSLAASSEPSVLSPLLVESTILTASGIRVLEEGASFQGSCKNCPRCGLVSSLHKNDVVVPLWQGYGATHQECISPSYCEGGHPPCMGGGAVEPMVTTILAADGAGIAKLLQEHANTAYLNRARQSIQVIGCTGSLDANVPLTDEQYRSLEVILTQ